MELQNIPSMTKLLDSSEFSDFDINQEILKKIINNTLYSVRKTVYSDKNNNLTDKDIKRQIVIEIKKIFDQEPKIVINGTGVILHTNIGRAPISKDIIFLNTSGEENKIMLHQSLPRGVSPLLKLFFKCS